MKLDLKQPKYILPLIALPFLCLFFYVYHSSSKPTRTTSKVAANTINPNVGEVSDDIKKKELTDKLDAYRDAYKDADGATAVNPVPVDKKIDSIKAVMQQHFSQPPELTVPQKDAAMVAALNRMQHQRTQTQPEEPKAKDPMKVFKQQMAYMDSITASRDSAKKPKRKAKPPEPKSLAVRKVNDSTSDFNTIRPDAHPGFITAVIDENLTGFAGSRIRLRLLEDIVAGKRVVPKDTYVYALISGFSEQRVTLSVKSILYDGQILPVKLELYDLDGLPGLYVPSSAFRDFTKDASASTVQGVDIESSSTSFIMSTADKLFQSTSSAIAGIIRKDKAKLKYNSYIYLIDNSSQNQTP